MQKVATDQLDANGHKWLVLVDRFSGYAWLKRLNKTASEHIIDTLTAWFIDHGWPASIRTDDRPQLRTSFKAFSENNNINHELASALNPEYNGLAEAAVKNMKPLVIRRAKQKQNLNRALAALWNMTRADGIIPSQLFFNRLSRQTLPMSINLTQKRYRTKKEVGFTPHPLPPEMFTPKIMSASPWETKCSYSTMKLSNGTGQPL